MSTGPERVAWPRKRRATWPAGAGKDWSLQHRHLQVGGDVSGEQGVLAAGAQGFTDLGKLLLGSGGEGGMGVGAGGDWDVRADGAEAYVIEACWSGLGWGVLIDVEGGRVGGGIDDTNLGCGLDSGDSLAAGEDHGAGCECSEPGGAGREMELALGHKTGLTGTQ